MNATMPSDEVIEEAVLLAGRAPSLHNSQPWHWVADGESLELYGDPSRLLGSTDPSGRQLVLSCGVVLHHLRAALAGVGWRTVVERFPNPNDPRHLATVTFAAADFVTDAARDRLDAIRRRRTDRLPFAAPDDWAGFEFALRSVLDDTLLTVLSDDVRPELARASAMTAAMRRYDSAYHAELHWWTGHSPQREGVPRAALVSGEERSRVSIGRAFPTDEHEPRRPELDRDHSTVLVLSTDGDTRLELLRCGEALSTVLLEATMAGLATCPLTHIMELPASRAVVRRLVGGRAQPQVLIRVGQAPHTEGEPAPTLRRTLREVLEVRE